MESPSTSRRCSTRVPVPASGRKSYAKSPSARAATTSARSSTKSAISLSSPSNPSNKNRWRGAWLIGLGISAAMLVWVLYKIDPRQVWSYAQHANFWLLLLAVVGATLPFPLRALRWRLILRDSGGRPSPVRRLCHGADGSVAGLAVLKSPARFAGVVFWSLVQWIINAAAFAVCFRAFGLAVPLEAALLLQGIIGFGVAVPSTPGFLGVFEAATLVTLQLYGVDSSLAVSYALTYHLTTFLPITLLGLWSLSRLHLKLREVSRPAGGNPA